MLQKLKAESDRRRSLQASQVQDMQAEVQQLRNEVMQQIQKDEEEARIENMLTLRRMGQLLGITVRQASASSFGAAR